MKLIDKPKITDTGCYEYIGRKNKAGYGEIRINNKTKLVHRYVYEIYNGPIPTNMKVCHSCDNPACYNIDHLWLGTQVDNLTDMYNKGRYINGFKQLEDDDISLIIQLRNYGLTQKEIGNLFNLDQSSISKAIKRYYND